jgi:transketolase
MDAVQAAKSGHPGAPMGLADIAEVLWRDVLRHNPANPDWLDRDRFVLSNGHSSMLLYAVLHLSGYAVSIDEIKAFRQLGSATPGHPEVGECPGVETTTGPLGQGLANGVGMALAERELARAFNRDDFDIIDHQTWVIAGDGCLMEGISHEAASLAGTLGLGKLNCIYDDNGISIDGETKGWFTEDVPARFEAYGWHVVRGVDGHDPEAVAAALAMACDERDKPTLICARTVIGFGSPNVQGKSSAHGSPLGDEEIERTRKTLNWSYAPFEISDAIYAEWDCREAGAGRERDWQARFDAYQDAYPELAAELLRRAAGELPAGWDDDLMVLAKAAQAEPSDLETRKSSQRCLSALGPNVPELIGGSADLSGSNGSRWEGAQDVSASAGGNYLNFGVREFAMTAISNGIALHGGFRPYSATFLVFMEYARNAVRLAALMGLPQTLVYTHDSVAVGEDGPTHQPVEQLTSLRTTPGLSVWRPCDTVESAFAWRSALSCSDRPSALVFTRQKTQAQPRNEQTFTDVARGGYVLIKERGELDAVVVATGSEVELAVAAATQLAGEGLGVRVVSMPCTDLFDAQDAAYRESVLPGGTRARVAVEAAHPEYWRRYVGLDGEVVGINRFGVSAPGALAMSTLGITAEAVASAVRKTVDEVKRRCP